MVLEPGGRVRVVAPRGNIGAVSAFVGDSYKALSEMDIGVFSLGLALSLLIGLIPIPLPGATFTLGLAGGPLGWRSDHMRQHMHSTAIRRTVWRNHDRS